MSIRSSTESAKMPPPRAGLHHGQVIYCREMPSRELDGPALVTGHASTVPREFADTEGPEAPVESASPIGKRPEPDRLTHAIARARIGNKLFAKDEQIRLGRYHLLEMVGRGGMGVVWGAWDPELK